MSRYWYSTLKCPVIGTFTSIGYFLYLICADSKVDGEIFLSLRRETRNASHSDVHLSTLLVDNNHGGRQFRGRSFLFLVVIRMRTASASEGNHETIDGAQRDIGHRGTKQ